MARTAAAYAVPAIVLAASWLRLESPRRGGEAFLVLLLALLPALAPTLRLRLAAAIVAGLAAAGIALDVSPFDERALGGGLKDGVLEFYDVRVPFSPVENAQMHGAVLLGLFATALVVALALASRRSLPAVVALAVGAGWPATLVTDANGTRIGIAILIGALWILVALRAQAPRAAIPAGVAAVAVVVVAGAAATSGTVAKAALLDWQGWDFYDTPSHPVGVGYVWDANYSGIHFPDKRTVVLRIRAPERAVYWRATVLEGFDGTRWFENLNPEAHDFSGRLPRDPLVPAQAPERWVEQDVEVVALRDDHLVAAASPVQLRTTELGAPVTLSRGGVARVGSNLVRGQHYISWSAVPQPTPKQLTAAKAEYPDELDRDLRVEAGVQIRPFGDPTRPAQVRQLLNGRLTENLKVYEPFVRRAERLTAGAGSPYAAVVALESWFRTGGGFTYDEQPPRPAALPPLVDFVLRTKAGYCQHYAGAMALMLRWLGIPARVAAGFTSGKFKDGTWTVTDHDAHAWVEAWFPGYGWLSFDPTPGRGLLSAGYTTASQFESAGESIRDALQGVGGGLDPTAGGPTFDTGGGTTAGSGGHPVLRAMALLLLVVVLGIGLAKLALRRLRYVGREPRRRAAAARRELADFLRDQRLDVPQSATLDDLRALLQSELGVDARAFSGAAGAARYGPPDGLDLAAVRTERELRALLRAIRRQLSTGDRVRGWLAIRSLRGA